MAGPLRLTRPACALRAFVPPCLRALALSLVICHLSLFLAACRPPGPREASREAVGRPPAPVVALGNLRLVQPPSEAQVRLAEFLFGAPPEDPLTIVKPFDALARGQTVWVADVGVGAILRFSGGSRRLDLVQPVRERFGPVSLADAPQGTTLVVDRAGRAVLRLDADGRVQARYVPPPQRAYRPADALWVAGQVWVSNVAAHAIEVFDASGRWLRSIGRRGDGLGEFGIPLGLARMPDGRVCVVDMLNQRVQVLSAEGEPLGVIGGPGDRVGRFGRPRDVAVGPDGTVFVVDAASQRVHAFDPQGRPLAAFGAPDGPDGLLLPAGISVAGQIGPTDRPLPAGFAPRYFVLVAEQLRRPGVRVFAWRGGADVSQTVRRGVAPSGPHWDPSQCSACHVMHEQTPQPIAPGQVDALCLRCHDGRRAPREPHPVGWPAESDSTKLPAGWPVVDGRLGCLTCHDVRRHCDRSARRPLENPMFLRGYDPQQPAAFCTKCHTASRWRISPHEPPESASGTHRTCAFCHRDPQIDASRATRRTGDAELLVEGSALCLRCHGRHWDFSPRGHVDRPLPEAWYRRLLTLDAEALGLDAPPGLSQRIALADGRVTCYSCHNPHPAGIFPAGSPLGSQAADRRDAKVRLRADRLELCLTCHGR